MRDVDKWTEAVFDGGDEGLERSLREAGPDRSRHVQELARLKADLQLLKDVPECQLTKEHLRNAVLSLPPRKRALPEWLSWSTVAAATIVTLVAFGKWFYDFDHPRPAAPDPNAGPGVGLLATDSVRPQPGTKAAPKVESSPVVAVRATGSNASRPSAPRRPVRTEWASSARDLIAAASVVATSGLSAAAPTLLDASLTDTLVEDQPKEPVVVVTSTPDPETGAPEAHEVSAPSDMVFGG